jgi:hypothetical protein
MRPYLKKQATSMGAWNVTQEVSRVKPQYHKKKRKKEKK